MSSAPAPDTLVARYTPGDLSLFDADEIDRFLAPFGELGSAALAGDGCAWERVAPHLAWELLYRKEPELWEALVRGERIHEQVLAWLPGAETAVEVAAGSGRLTLDIANRCASVVAIEPSRAFREMLTTKLSSAGVGNVDVRPGFFDAIPLPDASADLVVSCSSFTADPAHGGEPGLDEMHRVAASGAIIALVWPSDVEWLLERGFSYEAFDGEMCIEFDSLDEAVRLARIVYPWAVDAIAANGSSCVPYELIGMNAPRDVAWKSLA